MNIRELRLAGQIFPTKASLRKALMDIVESRRPGSRLSCTEKSLFHEVIARHPMAEEKIGPGIRAIRVERHPVFQSPMLVIERTDGTETDVSYRSAIARIGRSENDNGRVPRSVVRSNFSRAAREAIRRQIEDFRCTAQAAAEDPLGRLRCAATHALLPPNAVDVDHEQPWDFASILRAFVAERQIVVAQIEILGFEDGSTQRYFADPKLAEDFADFHQKRARLRIIDRAVHRRISAEARSRDARNGP